MRLIQVTLVLLILSGCAGQEAQRPPCPEVTVAVVEPPLSRYQIKYQNRGLKVVPDFAAIDRNGEYVVVPAP